MTSTTSIANASGPVSLWLDWMLVVEEYTADKPQSHSPFPPSNDESIRDDLVGNFPGKLGKLHGGLWHEAV